MVSFRNCFGALRKFIMNRKTKKKKHNNNNHRVPRDFFFFENRGYKKLKTKSKTLFFFPRYEFVNHFCSLNGCVRTRLNASLRGERHVDFKGFFLFYSV